MLKRGRLSRRELLAGAAAAGALGSAGVQAAGAAAASSDAAVLGKTLAVELLAVFAYQQVLRGGTLGSEAAALATIMLTQERAHVAVLETELRRLGGTPPPVPTTIAGADSQLAALHSSGKLTGLRTERGALDFLYDVEALTIGAHYLALEKLSNPQLVRTSVEIMGAEAQHAAAIGGLLHPGNFTRIVPIAYVRGKS